MNERCYASWCFPRMTRPRSITVILLLVFATLANAIVPLSERLTHGNGREGGRTPRSHTSTFSERRESLFSSPLFRDPLMEWLDKLHVDVPDQSFSTRWVNIEIRNLTCTHFSILDIESDYKNDGSGENSSSPEISLTIWQVAAACNGFYKSTGGVGGEITAHLVVKENEAALQWTVAVLDEKSSTVPRVPNAVETVSCTTEFVVTGLHFSGSLSAKLIELFRGKIEHAVNSAVENQVCPVIVKKVDPLLSHYLQTTVEWLRPYLTPNISVRSSLAVREEYVDVYEEESNLEADSYIIDFGKDLPVLSSVLESLNTFVAAHLNDGFLPHSSYCGGFSEGINGVIHEILPAGLWKLPVSEQHAHLVLPGYAAIDLHMHNVTATGEGLSHWKNLTVLRPHGSSFFQTALEMTSNVSLTMAVTLQVMAVPGGMFRDEALQESFVVQIDAEGITAAADLSVHLRKDLFQNINAGSLLAVLSGLMSDKDLSMTPEAACLLESFQSLKSSGLHVVLSLLGLSISPLHSAEKSTSSVLVRNEELEKDMDELFDNITRLFLTVYRPLVTDAIAGLTRGPIQERLNDFLANKIKKSPGVNCTNRDDNSSDQSRWVNFTTVQPLHSLNALLSEETALSGINRYLDCVTDAISGIIRQPPNHVSDFLHSAVTERGVQSFFGLNSLLSSSQLRDFEIKHAGSIRKVELLLPLSDGFHLQSSLRLGSNNTDAAVRPQIFASIDFDNIIASLDFDSVPFNLSAAVNITVFLNNIDWEGGSVLHYDSRRFQQMKLSQLLSHGQCALVPADEFEFYRFDANQGFFEIVMNATLTIAGGDSLSTRHFSIDSKEFSEVQVLVSSVFEWSLDTAQDMVAAVYKTAHSRSASSCGVGHSAGPQPPAKKRKGRIESNTVLLIIAAIFIFAQPAILLVKRSQDAVNEEVSLGQQDDLAELLLHDEIFVDGFPTNQETPACLMFDAKVSEVARHLIPIFILVVIATLLASNLSVGATVDLMVSLDEREIRLPSLFMFSLFNTAKDMLDAKIYPLFLLVVVFSGVWPYVKLALMLAAWISPKSVLSSESRGELLLKLDALSKFSLVDTYVLVVMLVAFRYHLQLIGNSALNVYVTPQFGFYGFLAATGASLVVGHLMIYFHRRSELRSVVPSTRADSLFNHAFSMEDGSSKRLSLSCRALLVTIFILVAVLLGFGITRQSFVFEFGGLAGLMLGDHHRSSYSLISLGTAIPESVEDIFGIGIHILQATFFFYAVVTPFATLFLLFVILVHPLTLQRQSQLLTLAEIANAWSAIEVFVLSIIAALFEISTFASFIIGHRCDAINKVLTAYSNGEVNTCYTVTSTVSWDVLYLVLGAVLNSGWVSLVLRFLHVSMHQRLREAKGVSQEFENSTFVHRLAASRFLSWVLSTDDDFVDPLALIGDAGPPIVSEEILSSPWLQPMDGSTEEWKDVAERDPSWKEWKEATNVT